MKKIKDGSFKNKLLHKTDIPVQDYLENIAFVGVAFFIVWFLIGYNICECRPFFNDDYAREDFPYRLYWYQDVLLLIWVWSIVGYNLIKIDERSS